jgi:hypothetical protein
LGTPSPITAFSKDAPGTNVCCTLRDLAGGHHEPRTGAEGCVGVRGIAFLGFGLSLMMFVRQEPPLAMMLSVYVTPAFLCCCSRNPSANRSLIAFTAWSSFAHSALMAVQAFRNFIARGELLGVSVLIVIGVALIVLAPAKKLAPTTAQTAA